MYNSSVFSHFGELSTKIASEISALNQPLQETREWFCMCVRNENRSYERTPK
jgi:hypothetical protein